MAGVADSGDGGGQSDERAPGVYIEETSYRSSIIAGVPTWIWPLTVIFVAFAFGRLRLHRRISG